MLINRRNVTGDHHSSYRPNRDFLYIVFQSRVIAAAMTVLGFPDKNGSPANYHLPTSMEKMRKAQKLDYLHKISAKVVDAFLFQSSEEVNNLIDGVLAEEKRDILQQQELTDEGRFPCRFPGCNKSFKYNGKTRRNHELSHEPPVQVDSPTPVTTSTPTCTDPPKESKPGDDVYNYTCALMTDCFLFFNFLDAIKEGDGARIMRQYKYIMLYCKADGSHSTKYALECLYQFFQVYALLSPRDSERFVWNRTINNSGKEGTNIPFDEDTEHSNNFIKQGIKKLEPNVTENAVQRLSREDCPTASTLANLDDSIEQLLRSGKHGTGNLEKDLDELVKRAVEFNIFTELAGRSYKQFSGFQRNRLAKLDVSSLHQWINKHKKNIMLGIKAR